MSREMYCPAGLTLRNLNIAIPLALAPMVGLSHTAGRSLIQEIGGVGILYTEMLAAKRLPHENADISPMLVKSELERPLIYQIFLADESPVEGAIAKLEALGADGVDMNLGCPAPQLRRSGSGGYLAEDRQLVARIVRKIRLSTEMVFTAKIRLGQKLDQEKFIDFCKMLEGEGIDLLTVHGRLHGENFCRPPRWDWIGHAKKAVHIPVIANGGIFSVDDARRCLDISGADGLMIGRGAFENPWLFADIAATVYGMKYERQMRSREQLFYRFVELLETRFRTERRLGRLKQFIHYFARSFSFGHQLASSVQTSKSIEEAVERSAKFFSQTDPVELLFQPLTV